ncbi:MAG: hypothetical protein K5910_09660 [Bacteroidales bacterium]|nr:hypothetical protein [Bacteroidales bacterium]
MKKNILIYIASIAVLFSAGCAREPFPGDENGRGFSDGQTGLVLNVRSTNPETKAIAPPDTYNEDRLEQFYYFIYKNDPSVNTSEAPVFLGKWTAPEGEVVTGTGTEEKITLDDLLDLASADGTTYSGYAYIIANYKVAETLAAWDAVIAAPSATGYAGLTWTNLQALPLPKPTFQVYNDISGDSSLWPAEQMNEKADEGHRFQAQDSFVMTSTPTAFTVSKGTPASIDVPLTRVAAKISLDIKLAQWYVQTNNNEYKYTWYSKPERVQVYLNYAADRGTLDGTPLTYSDAGDFFTYRRFAFLQDAAQADGSYVPQNGDYTEKEPLKWVLNESMAAETQPVDGVYYTADEDQAGKIVEIGGEIKYKEYTRPAYEISGTPFYSYPYDYSADSGHAPFFKVIVEWDAYKESRPATATATGSKDNPEIFAREFYYKITIPDQTLLSANKWYKINLQLAVLGSEADETAIDLVGEQGYYVVDWSDPTKPYAPDLNAGRYLSVTSAETEKVDGEDVPVFKMYGGAPFEIPMTSSHEVEIVNATATYEVFNPSSTASGSLTKSSGSASGDNYMLEPTSLNAVTLSHTLETTVTSMSSRDVSVITYDFTIRHSDDPDFAQKVRVYQYPSIYVQQMDGGNAFLDGFFQFLDQAPTGFTSPITVTSPSNGYRSVTYSGNQFYTYVSTYTAGTGNSGAAGGWTAVQTPYGQLSYDNGSPVKTTLVTVTAFSSTSEKYQPRTTDPTYTYSISDPRVPQNWDNHLTPYLTNQTITGNTATITTAAWENEENIKVGSGIITSGDQNLSPIAPAFLISSRWGRGGNANNAQFPTNLQEAEQRCATYQEAGYPAGRWRLPTEAEVYFVYQLQQQQLIEGLFTAGGYGYISASGRTFGYQSHTYFENRLNNNMSFRCVYDYWYWGEKDRNVYKFTPKP